MGGKVAQLLASRRPSKEMKEQQLKAYDSPEAAAFVVREVLTAGGLQEEDVMMLVEDTQRGNEWARKAWPAYGMEADYSADLRNIAVPVKIVVAAQDKVEPVGRVRSEVQEKINVYIGENDAKASMVVVEGSGHMLPLEKPYRLAEEIRAFSGGL